MGWQRFLYMLGLKIWEGAVCHLQCDLTESSLWLVPRREFSQKRADAGTAPGSQGKVISTCNSIPHQRGIRGFFLLLCVLEAYLNNRVLGLGCCCAPASRALRSRRALPDERAMSVGPGVLAPVTPGKALPGLPSANLTRFAQ